MINLSTTDSNHPEHSRERAREQQEGERSASTIEALQTRLHNRMSPFVETGREAIRQREEEERMKEERNKAERQRKRNLQASMSVLPVQIESSSVPPPAHPESLKKGIAVAALGTGAAVSVLPAYAPAIGNLATQTAMGILPTASQAGLTLGIPALAGAAGYFAGKKLGHPVAGAAVGTAAGTASVLSYLPYQQALSVAAQAGATQSEATLVGLLGTAGTAGSLAWNAGVVAAGGAALYGLGRWHGKLWSSKPAGILKTMARGCVSPVSIPLGYLKGNKV